jgi:hypothetical protein
MTAVLVRRGNLVRVAAGPVALAVGLGALAVARGPGRFTTYAGGSGLAAALTVATGLGLVAAGLVTAFSRPAGRIGDLAVLAGLVWFAPVWVGWDKGSPLVRSLGMLAAGFAFPLLRHLVLAFPGGQPRGAIRRALIFTVYLEAALAAIGLALFRKPFFDPDCWANCSDNLFLVDSLPRLAHRIGVAAPGRAVTILVRDGRRMAVVSHTAALPDLERELGAAVRLALENERLQAEALAHLDQLRASRVRIVETGDSERRRPVRDLHDHRPLRRGEPRRVRDPGGPGRGGTDHHARSHTARHRAVGEPAGRAGARGDWATHSTGQPLDHPLAGSAGQ